MNLPLSLESLEEQAKGLCKSFKRFEWLEDEFVPICQFLQGDNPMKEYTDEQVCVKGNDACRVCTVFDGRIKSIERLAKLATKRHGVDNVTKEV